MATNFMTAGRSPSLLKYRVSVIGVLRSVRCTGLVMALTAGATLFFVSGCSSQSSEDVVGDYTIQLNPAIARYMQHAAKLNDDEMKSARFLATGDCQMLGPCTWKRSGGQKIVIHYAQPKNQLAEIGWESQDLVVDVVGPGKLSKPIGNDRFELNRVPSHQP